MEQFIATVKSNVDKNRASENPEILYKQLYGDVLCKLNKIILDESETSVDGQFKINLLELIKSSPYYGKYLMMTTNIDEQIYNMNTAFGVFYESFGVTYSTETNYDPKEKLIKMIFLRVIITV